jgi:hypothetical protein
MFQNTASAHIEIIEFLGKKDEVSRYLETMWRVGFVGLNGEHKPAPEQSPYGTPSYQVALEMAEYWSRFFGLSIQYREENQNMESERVILKKNFFKAIG